MIYCVIDTEITTRNRGDDAVGDMQASPYHPANEVVAIGYATPTEGYGVMYGAENIKYAHVVICAPMLIFQNASFDFQWLLRLEKDKVLEWVRVGGAIWDSQVAEYILTGQEHTYASLDELALKYGGTQKDNKIKAYWDAGIDTDKIPKDELLEYLKHDVLNTELVFKAQMEEAEGLGMLPLMRNAMEDRLATILMEWNGMRFDTETAKQNVDVLKFKRCGLSLDLLLMSGVAGEMAFNPASPQHVSKVLFGGTNEYRTTENVLNPDGTEYRYKTGNRAGEVKTHYVWKEDKLLGFGIIPDPAWEGTNKEGKKTGIFSTSEANLTELMSRVPAIPKDAAGFITLLLEYKGISKDISTYYEGYTKLTWPTDGCLHGSINHCLTITGRLSCSAPNLTNVSREDE